MVSVTNRISSITPVLAAIILSHDGTILLAQRKADRINPLKWEYQSKRF